jgi:hypothetical protein
MKEKQDNSKGYQAANRSFVTFIALVSHLNWFAVNIDFRKYIFDLLQLGGDIFTSHSYYYCSNMKSLFKYLDDLIKYRRFKT